MEMLALSGIPLLLLLVSVLALAVFSLLLYSNKLKQKKIFEKQLAQAKHDTDEAAKAKDIFLANISHETRTPMNAIIGLSHILLQTELSYEQKTNLFKIKRSAEHLLSMTNDILDYSKLEAGKLTLEKIGIENINFFSNLSDLITPSAVEKKLDLIFDIAPDFPERWYGDPLRLTQIVLNLLNNAVKFTEKGTVTLRAATTVDEETESTKLLFEISDTGIGLTEAQQKNLFKAFGQADNSISRKFGGTGLGLAISSELALMMGSKLNVKSKYAEGSTFYFTLPFEPVMTEEKKEDRLLRRLLDTKTILIFDRCRENSAVLASILGHYGARPSVADSHAAVERMLQYGHYNAICLDSRLIGTFKDPARLKKHCDAIVLMQYEVLPDRESRKFSANAVLSKPFSPLLVQSTMTDIFGKAILENRITKQHIEFNDILVLSGAKVLLAEDNEGNVMVIEGLLEGSGIRIDVAPNGRKAVEAIMSAKQPYDLVLMDINMPIMDGFSATSIIREYQKYDDIPIVAMTANITESDMNKTKSVGMQDFLGKPIDVERFYTVLLKYIRPKLKSVEIVQVEPEASEPETDNLSGNPAPFYLPKVDVKAGLERLNGNQQAYLKILRKFSDLFSDITVRLAKMVDADDFEQGRQIAHNLKGLSGNIGADEIYKLASKLEESFKSGNRDLSPDIKVLDDKLSELLKAIDTLLKESKKTPEAGIVTLNLSLADEAVPTERADAEISTEHITPAALSGILESLMVSAQKKKALELKQGCAYLLQYDWPDTSKASIGEMIKYAHAYEYDKVIRIIEKILKEQI